MQQTQQERPPPAYSQHDPDSLVLPSVPTHQPGQQNGDRLPGIRSLLPDASVTASAHKQQPQLPTELSPPTHFRQPQWGPLPPVNGTRSRTSADAPRISNEADIGSPMDTASAGSPYDNTGELRRTSMLSVDDPDVRLAAEALSGLGNPGR
jgi:hypothetical protein